MCSIVGAVLEPPLRVFAIVLCCGTLLLSAACASPPSPLQIALVNEPGAGAPHIRVSGLSSGEATALAGRAMSDEAWHALMRVTVVDSPTIAIVGRYRIAGRTIEFEPTFPFDPGRVYAVHVEPAKLPTPRLDPALEASVSLPRRDPGPPTEVVAIYPSGDVWPANVLRFYVHFSGPMSRASGVPFLRLLDDHDREVPDALLPAAVDFWSPDQRRYTAFFDPGRVKRGILPNAVMGRALVMGRRYTIVADAAWLDAAGRPLVREFRRTIAAGAAREQPIKLTDWVVRTPPSGSRDPLVVSLPWGMDQALLERTLGVEFGGQAVGGHSETASLEAEWRFVPTAPWQPGAHALVVLPVLEDPSGNRIDQPFEIVPSDPVAHREPPDRYRVPFDVR